jgi:hypothetical protein
MSNISQYFDSCIITYALDQGRPFLVRQSFSNGTLRLLSDQVVKAYKEQCFQLAQRVLVAI